MKRSLAVLFSLSALLLQSCGGGSGSPADPPGAASGPGSVGVTAVAKDSRVTLAWPMEPGVEYWVFRQRGPGASPEKCQVENQTQEFPCETYVNVRSPFTATAVKTFMINDDLYSFSINGRRDGGPGGPGSVPVEATPRIAGNIWTTGNSGTTNDLRGIAYGTYVDVSDGTVVADGRTTIDRNGFLYFENEIVPNGIPFQSSIYIAVGANGTLLRSLDGKAWRPINSPTNDAMNAVTYNALLARFVAVGANGVIWMSPDGITWSVSSSGTPVELNSVTTDNLGQFVAVGASGTILFSSDGSNWVRSDSGTLNTLYSVMDATNILGLGYIAVGASGTMLYSTDGINWQTIASGVTASTLRSVTGGIVIAGTTLTPLLLAVGDNGTILASLDGQNWVSQQSPSTAQLNAVAYGRQFIIGGNDGSIYTSLDGFNWAPTTTRYTNSPIYNISVGGIFSSIFAYDYAAVGAGGLSMLAE
jgi:photosystem II stability/assembly factor-like uncharacterized protein